MIGVFCFPRVLHGIYGLLAAIFHQCIVNCCGISIVILLIYDPHKIYDDLKYQYDATPIPQKPHMHASYPFVCYCDHDVFYGRSKRAGG